MSSILAIHKPDILISISLTADILSILSLLILINTSWKPQKIKHGFSKILLLMLFTQIISKVLWFNESPNLFVLHIYTLLEFIFISLFYRSTLDKIEFFQRHFRVLLIGLSVLIVLNTIFLQQLSGFNTHAKILTQIVYITYAIAYFIQEISNYRKTAQQQLLTVINSAILIYYSSSLFIFMFSNIFEELDDRHRIFWIINASLYVAFQLIIFIGIARYKSQLKATRNIK
jgi:hypothetical protein